MCVPVHEFVCVCVCVCVCEYIDDPPTARAAELLVAMRASTSSAEDSEEWDVTNHVAPMCDRLVAVHGWSPLEVCAVLEEIMVRRRES